MISVITAVFNGKQYIEYCIKNVIAQDCPDIEHIIVDGGSTDGTVEIIKSYAQKYPHIRWISEKDKGQSDALNKGVAMAKGEIVGILDYDDFYEPNVLSRVSQIFTTLPEPSLVTGNTNFLTEDDQFWWVSKLTSTSLIDWLSAKSRKPVTPAYFYHKSLHQQIGLYDLENHYSMDADFLYRAVQVAHIEHIDETFGNRRHLDSTKTMQLHQSNQAEAHVKGVLEKYRKQLPLLQAWQVKIQQYIYHWYYNSQYVKLKELATKVRGSLRQFKNKFLFR